MPYFIKWLNMFRVYSKIISVDSPHKHILWYLVRIILPKRFDPGTKLLFILRNNNTNCPKNYWNSLYQMICQWHLLWHNSEFTTSYFTAFQLKGLTLHSWIINKSRNLLNCLILNMLCVKWTDNKWVLLFLFFHKKWGLLTETVPLWDNVNHMSSPTFCKQLEKCFKMLSADI